MWQQRFVHFKTHEKIQSNLHDKWWRNIYETFQDTVPTATKTSDFKPLLAVFFCVAYFMNDRTTSKSISICRCSGLLFLFPMIDWMLGPFIYFVFKFIRVAFVETKNSKLDQINSSRAIYSTEASRFLTRWWSYFSVFITGIFDYDCIVFFRREKTLQLTCKFCAKFLNFLNLKESIVYVKTLWEKI